MREGHRSADKREPRAFSALPSPFLPQKRRRNKQLSQREKVIEATSVAMSKVVHIRYTFGMAKIDDIYEAVDDFGLITSAEAREHGMPNAELVQLARRGKLRRVARGVYRMPVWPYQEAAPYAIAVKSAGPDAYLYGESVVALLGLAPTDPGRMWVASPGRVRRSLGEGVRVVERQPKARVEHYEGVPSQPVADAVRAAAGTMGRSRALQAAEEAERLGYLAQNEKDRLVEELEG